jgi:hypothetical protein
MHGQKKFHPKPSFSFLCETEIWAWCEPAFDMSSLNKGRLGHLQEIQLTVVE